MYWSTAYKIIAKFELKFFIKTLPPPPFLITNLKTNVSCSIKHNSILPYLKRAITHTTYQYHENKENQYIIKKSIEAGYDLKTLLKLKNQANPLKYIGAIKFNKLLYPIIHLFKEYNAKIAFKSIKSLQLFHNSEFSESFAISHVVSFFHHSICMY